MAEEFTVKVLWMDGGDEVFVAQQCTVVDDGGIAMLVLERAYEGQHYDWRIPLRQVRWYMETRG